MDISWIVWLSAFCGYLIGIATVILWDIHQDLIAWVLGLGFFIMIELRSKWLKQQKRISEKAEPSP